MQLSRILSAMTEEGGLWTARVGDTWLQGRSLFGGVQAAVAVRAMRSVLAQDLPLRVLQMTFAAPVSAGAVEVRPVVVRAGKSVTHVEARLAQDGKVAALVVGVFGASRPSRVRVTPGQPPSGAEREPIRIPYIEGVTPRFTQHFDIAWLRGDPPYSSSKATTAVIEVGMRDEGHATTEHVLAIADSIPPLALSHLDSPAAGSSMTWTFETLSGAAGRLPARGFRLDVDLVAGGDGYTSQSVMVWGPGGEPVALSRQSMVVFG